jgi:sugar phosphate isomerase/epimerase
LASPNIVWSRRILIFIIPGQTQSLFTPGLCPADGVDRHRYHDLVDIRPVKIDFPLSLDGSPEPQARLLLDVVELNPEVLRADAGDGLAQEGAILFDNSIDSSVASGKHCARQYPLKIRIATILQLGVNSMTISRRRFLQSGAAATVAALSHKQLIAYAAQKGVKFKIGAPDWNLRLTAKIESVALAKKIGFDGVQVSIGRQMQLKDEALQKAYLDESKKLGFPIASLCLDILHVNGLKSDPLGKQWVAESIPIAKAMGVKVILLPFFSKWALQTQAEMDYVGDALREIAPAAEKAGVILGLEDTISARDNARIMERSKSPSVLTYYDVGNSTNNGFNIIEEIRWLGRERICEVHLKDNPNFLGQGKIDFTAVVDALADIGFDKWAQLECDSPTRSVENDMGANLKFIRGVIAKRNG